jgi:predicted MPP superfamily phosphohydrolase
MSNITVADSSGLALALPAALGADSTLRETTTLRVTKLNHGTGPCRFVHFSDFHYRGDDEFATRVVNAINELGPDFVCFTGDLAGGSPFARDRLHS